MEWTVAQMIMQLMSDVSIFTHVCGQTVYTSAAIKLLNSIDIGVKHDTFVFVLYDTFLSCYICNF